MIREQRSRRNANPKAVIENGQVFLRRPDGSYQRHEPQPIDPALVDITDDEIDRQIADNPDTAREMTVEDAKRARIVKPLYPAKS